MDRSRIVADVVGWYVGHARDLPWRRAGVTPWGVMVSEFMLQQTPVSRVLGPWQEWLARWPTPSALAAAEPGEAVRAWGRLGYPRRAQRLHLAARAIVADHAGEVPADPAALRRLPGVGEYTAAAIASFGFGDRHAVLDTNVRRVLARLGDGRESAPAHLTVPERQRAERWLPEAPEEAARWSVAVMELGALVCTAADPGCHRCPVADDCRWVASGRPPAAAGRRPQPFAGTDRQARGVLLDVLRRTDVAMGRQELLAAWPIDSGQAVRALDSLVADRLIREVAPRRYAL